MIPQVDNSVLDNQLGVRAPASAALLIVGTSPSGSVATPTPCTRTEDAKTAFGNVGQLVEGAAYAIERYGLRTLLVKATSTTPGSYGAVALAGTGTSVPTGDVGTTQPLDECEVHILVTLGGTVGTGPIKYKDSVDGGRTLSEEKTITTATQILIPEYGIDINLGAGTLVTGDVITARTVAPKWDASALDAALESARVTQSTWTYGLILGDCDAAALSTIDGKLTAMANGGRNRRVTAHFRKKDAGESETTYLTAFQTAMSAASSKRVDFVAGDCELLSSLSRKQFLRSPAIAVGALVASVSEEIEPAELAFPLPGVVIRDANGNPKYHDETVNPGLDDARATVLRTWEGRTGVYINNTRLFVPVGSDYLYVPYGRIVDMACTIVREELEPELNKGVFVMPDGTGRISDDSAESIEGKINARLEREITGQRKAVRCVFSLNRNDNVLTTGQISYTTRVVPLAYVKKFKGTVALVASASADANVLNG